MLGVSYIDDWTVGTLDEFILEQGKEISEAARQHYKKDYEDFIEEMGRDYYKTEAEMWEAFVIEQRDNCDDPDVEMECILDIYIKTQKIPCAVVEWHYSENDDAYRLYILQVVPNDIEDLKELIEMYVKEHGTADMAECVSEVLLQDVK
jgi:hypothetical protein